MNLNLSDDPTVDQASQMLTSLEADEAKLAGASQPESTLDTATTGDRGPDTEKETVQTPESKPDTGTPADKEPQGTKPPTEPAKGTKFAQNAERFDRSWKKHNEEKAAFAKERETLQATLKAEREAFAKEKADFEAQRQAASAPKYTPDQVEAKAKEWLAEAERAEAKGDFKRADYARFKADDLSAYAKELKANPPKTTEQQAADKTATEAKLQEDQKTWWGKAAIDFPEVAKKDSEMAKTLSGIITPPGKPGNNPTLYDKVLSNVALNTPEGMYYVARLVNAETLAARVPKLETDLGASRAKVKELAGKLAIPMEGAATTHDTKAFGQMTEDEQDKALRAELQAAGQEASYL